MFYAFLATNGVVLATEKKQKSILYDDSSIHKIELITKNIGMVYSGMGPDYRYAELCIMYFSHLEFKNDICYYYIYFYILGGI